VRAHAMDSPYVPSFLQHRGYLERSREHRSVILISHRSFVCEPKIETRHGPGRSSTRPVTYGITSGLSILRPTVSSNGYPGGTIPIAKSSLIGGLSTYFNDLGGTGPADSNDLLAVDFEDLCLG
jgi:hypothetical protein